MRRSIRERPVPGMFRGGELPRLVSGITMLVVLIMLYQWMRDAQHWRWLADDAVAQSHPPEQQMASPITEPAGPTDEDPDQLEEARQELLAVTDGTLRLGPEEMEAYDRFVEWVKNQPFSRLNARAQKELRYTNLYDDIEKYRGTLVALDVYVRMAFSAGKNRYGVPLFEAWATTDQSRGRLFWLVVVDYPKGMPTGDQIYAKAKFAGYLLKLQGYEPASAKPGQPPEKTPLLIGRLLWQPVETPKVDNSSEWKWGVGILGVIAVAFVIRKYFFKRHLKAKGGKTIGLIDRHKVISIDQWLEQAEFDNHDDHNKNERR